MPCAGGGVWLMGAVSEKVKPAAKYSMITLGVVVLLAPVILVLAVNAGRASGRSSKSGARHRRPWQT
jgi:hypothetical protein